MAQHLDGKLDFSLPFGTNWADTSGLQKIWEKLDLRGGLEKNTHREPFDKSPQPNPTPRVFRFEKHQKLNRVKPTLKLVVNVTKLLGENKNVQKQNFKLNWISPEPCKLVIYLCVLIFDLFSLPTKSIFWGQSWRNQFYLF